MPKIVKTNSGLGFVDIFSSAKSHIPNWYKIAKPYTDSKIIISNMSDNADMKRCVPFLDGLTSGYMIELWTDVQVKFINGQPRLTWLVEPDPVVFRYNTAKEFPIPQGYHNQHMAWHLPCFMQTPKGYSTLFSHPLNRYDLPFLSLSAVVDTDATLFPGNYPFFIKDGWEGIIPSGTPIAQLLPFKREDWQRENSEEIVEIGNKRRYDAQRMLTSIYKKEKWHKKEYN